MVLLILAAGCGTDPEGTPRAIITTTAPTVTDDIDLGYPLDSVWVDTTKALSYELIDNTPGAAVWKQLWSFYVIGDTGPGGGIVFYITDGGSHGLEAAPSDQGTLVIWGCFDTPISGADGITVGTGLQNTLDIIFGCGTPGIAAKLAQAFTINGEADWFLPSKDELNLMYLNIGQGSTTIGNVGGLVSHYWSSSESVGNFAWYQILTDGLQFEADKRSTFGVRAVRAF